MYTCDGFILIFGKSNTVMLSLKKKKGIWIDNKGIPFSSTAGNLYF